LIASVMVEEEAKVPPTTAYAIDTTHPIADHNIHPPRPNKLFYLFQPSILAFFVSMSSTFHGDSILPAQ
ncbi:MAG: hypothetical protein ACRELF_25390, partial [Gemmataceae bacterium]